MKSNRYRLVLAVLLGGGLLTNGQAALKSAKVTDYKGNVTLSQGGATPQQVQIDSQMTQADVVRTGTASLAELQFNDETLTRLGANTIFNFSPKNRVFGVEAGTALLQVPPGLGGANIRVAGVAAAITGTTVMVQKLQTGLVKLMVLEGSMNVTLTGKNQMRALKAGQMLIILPDAKSLPEPITIKVATIMATSNLVNGFRTDLRSVEKIDEAEKKQNELTGNGGLKSGGVVITTPEDLVSLIGNNVLTSATFDALTQNLETGQSVSSSVFDGAVTIGPGAVLAPTLNGVLGSLTLSTGESVSAIAGSSVNDTVFVLNGPVTFNGQLPTISTNSPGTLYFDVVGSGLLASDPAISFINSTNQTGGDFAGPNGQGGFFTAASGAVVFNNANFNVTEILFAATTGDLNISNNSNLVVEDAQTSFYAGNNMQIDSSTVALIDLNGGATFSSNGTMTVNNSILGGNTGAGNTLNLSANGNISILNSLIGGSGVSNITVYAHNGANLSILNSQIVGSVITLGGSVVNLTGTTINASSSVDIFANSIIGGSYTGSVLSPTVHPYTP